jgi:hypothetical protein
MTIVERGHLVGYGILLVIWFLLPFFVVKEPMTTLKRAFVAGWYLGAALGLAVYLVTR